MSVHDLAAIPSTYLLCANVNALALASWKEAVELLGEHCRVEVMWRESFSVSKQRGFGGRIDGKACEGGESSGGLEVEFWRSFGGRERRKRSLEVIGLGCL